MNKMEPSISDRKVVNVVYAGRRATSKCELPIGTFPAVWAGYKIRFTTDEGADWELTVDSCVRGQSAMTITLGHTVSYITISLDGETIGLSIFNRDLVVVGPPSVKEPVYLLLQEGDEYHGGTRPIAVYTDRQIANSVRDQKTREAPPCPQCGDKPSFYVSSILMDPDTV